jgi:hypothetical protein
LSLNVKKSKLIVLNRSNSKLISNVDIYINNEKLEQVSEFKYLGVMIDNKLDWNDQCNEICKKFNKKFYVLKRCGSKMNMYSRILYCNALVRPTYDYCASISFMFNQAQFNQIQLIQNRFMRYILKVNNRTSIKWMLDTLQWQSIKARIYCNTFKFIRRIEQGNAPMYLKDKLRRRSETTDRRFRDTSYFVIAPYAKDYTAVSIFINGLQLYNAFIKKSIAEKRPITINTLPREFNCEIAKFVNSM